jgi:hypothetical protein
MEKDALLDLDNLVHEMVTDLRKAATDSKFRLTKYTETIQRMNVESKQLRKIINQTTEDVAVVTKNIQRKLWECGMTIVIIVIVFVIVFLARE